MASGQYPRGIVTFVFTDLEGSTATERRLREAFGTGLYEQHLRDPQRDRLWDAVARCGGVEIDRAGDGHFFAFPSADAALAAVIGFQQSLADNPIIYTAPDGTTHTVRVRAGVHTSRQELEPVVAADGKVEYSGTDVNFAARIGGLGVGGQIILSDETRKRAGNIGAYTLHPWPARLLKSFADAPQDVYEILYRPGQEPREPGSRFFPEFYKGEQNRYIPRPDKEADVFKRFRDRRRDGRTPRMVTIKADGGMGKIRLAVACAVRMAGAFEHGVHLVNLTTTLPSAEAVAEAIGQSLGLTGEAALPDKLLASLADRTLLLVLDNYESVKSDAAGRFLARLVTETRGVHLLTTGRATVGVSNIEQQVDLDHGMSDDEARDLFVARARLKNKLTADPTPAEAEQIKRILDLTERIPLAVELAAAWVEFQSLKEIADGLAATPLGEMAAPPPGELMADDHATGGRHHSLERSLDWSYGLLGKQCGAAAQQVFAACGLFADTFDAPAAADVSAVPTAKFELIRLQGLSLVRRAEAGDETRYRLHRFTRGYAAKRLAERPDAADVRRRFVRHYRTLVRTHFRKYNDLGSLSRMEKEWRNAVAAAEVAESDGDRGAVMELSLVFWFLDFHGLWSEALQVNRRAVNATKAAGDRRAEGVALNNLGIVYQSQARYTEAADAYAASLAICREFGDRVDEGRTLNNLGIVYQRQARYAEAAGAYAASLAIHREFGNHMGEGRTLNNLGLLYEQRGQYAEAAGAYAASLAICREFGDRVGEGATLNNLGIVHRLQGRYAEAAGAYAASLAIRRAFGDRVGEGSTLNNLGVVYVQRGRYAEAADAYAASLAIRRAFGDRIEEGRTLRNLALLCEAQGDLPQAVSFARQAVAALEVTQAAAALEDARRTLARLEGGGSAGGGAGG